MQILRYPEDREILDKKIFFYDTNDESLIEKVGEIIREVDRSGDDALRVYARKFDKINLEKITFDLDFPNTHDEKSLPLHPGFSTALEEAIANITVFHQQQLPEDITFIGKYGEVLGQKFTPVDRAGIYMPGGTGGKTPLISTLLMNVIPAQIAGVREISVITPPSEGGINPHLRYALHKLGIERIYLSGGAQGIAALAYGTETVPAVDLIVGPGNRYVNTAKKLVFGKVMIDALSGHSEIVIWADSSSRPDWVAADLLSQAEHAGGELTVLVTENQDYAHQVITEVEKQTGERERSDLIRSSLEKRGAVVLVKSHETAVEVINHIAPEHIEILIPEGEKLVPLIKHAGAIFLGEYASEPIGDYICGSNHVLPTNRSARFSSPLGVYTFLKRTNVIQYNQAAFTAYSGSAEVLAEVERLTAHKYALEVRKKR